MKSMGKSSLLKINQPRRGFRTNYPNIFLYSRRIVALILYIITFRLKTKVKDHGGIKAFLKSCFAHVNPLIDDPAIIVPLNYPTTNLAPSIAIVCHIFYVDLINEILSYLNNIPYPFDVYITTDTPLKINMIEEGFAAFKKGKLEVRLAPNRGRDIAPKLITYRDVYDKYEFILHIHTKKSMHNAIFCNWRTHLFKSLMGSEEIVKSIFESFYLDKQLGMVAPQHFVEVKDCIGWGTNFKQAKNFAAMRLGILLDKQQLIDFPSGSMFWARSAALKPLLDCNLDIADFQEEKRQTDGTLGHVIERLYFIVCEKSNYKWIKITPFSEKESNEHSVQISSQDELLLYIKNTQRDLLANYRDNEFFNIQ